MHLVISNEKFSDVFRIFQEFYAEIKNQFNTSIKILRINNTREYMSS